MPEFLKPFEVEAQNCERIITGGGFLLVSPLVCPNDEPVEVTYTVTGAVAAGDTVINLVHDQAESEVIRAGANLTVGGTTVTTTARVEIPTGAAAVAVPIAAAPAAIADAETFKLGSKVLKLLSPTNLPINLTAQTEDTTDLTDGIKSSEGVVSVTTSMQVSAFDSLEDEALYNYLFREADRGGQVFALAVRKNGVHTAGRAFVTNFTSDQASKQFSKIQTTLNFQGGHANIRPYKFLDATEQTALNNLRAFLGLSSLTA